MGNHKKNQPQPLFSETLEAKLLSKNDVGKNIFLSVILPVYNCSESIGRTLDSLVQQKYAPMEVIVIDARSKDRTLEVVSSYSALISRIYSVSAYNAADMINRGISLSSGDYVTFLYPGTFYLSPLTLQTFAEKIQGFPLPPDLIYCGSIQREIKREPNTILLPFEKKILEKGKCIATAPACWFKTELFDKIGKFNTRYPYRFHFDFFCRLAKAPAVNFVKIDRVYVDFDFGRFSYGKARHIAFETWSILCHHFGLRKALFWSFSINHFLIFKWMWSRFKYQLSKR